VSSSSAGTRVFYGWLIVGVSAVANMLAWSVRSTFALFYVALLQEFGWPRGAAALGYSLSWLFLVVFSPLAGRAYDRFGPRVVVPAGGVLLGCALAGTARVSELWQYALVFGILGAAGIAFVMMPAAAVIPPWFVRARGTAIGIVSAGSSVSAVLFYPLNAWLIERFGWRSALDAYALIVVLGIAPAAAWLYRRSPAEIGAGPDGEPAAPPPARSDAGPGPAAPDAEWPLGAALRTVEFWAVFAMWGLGVVGYQIMSTHQVAHALERGVSPGIAAWAFGAAGLFTTAGNLLGGALSDRGGRESVFIWGSVIAVAGIVCFAVLGGPWAPVLLTVYVVTAVGFGMRISQLTTIPADLFHGPRFGTILGLANAGGGIGGFIGPFLGGYLFDLTGDYRVSFVVAALAIVAAAVAAWMAAPRHAGEFRARVASARRPASHAAER
jgi:MFS family permease